MNIIELANFYFELMSLFECIYMILSSNVIVQLVVDDLFL